MRALWKRVKNPCLLFMAWRPDLQVLRPIYGGRREANALQGGEQSACKPKHVQICANPQAGSFRFSRLQAVTAHLVSQGHHVFITNGHPSRLSLDKVDELVVIGGDGTVREAVAAICGQQKPIPLHIVPAGTINLLARELAEQVPGGAFALCHVARANTHIMTTCLSVGPDAAIIATLSEALKRKIGRFAYGVAAVRLLWFWRETRYRVKVDGKSFDCAALYVAKGRYYAGPWSFAPQADIRGASLHAVALLSGRRRNYLLFLAALVLGRVEKLKSVLRFHCDQLEIEGPQASAYQIDGDIGGVMPVRVTVDPGKIELRLLQVTGTGKPK